MKMKITIWAISLGFGMSLVNAAEPMSGDGACSQDIQTHCSGVQPGEGHIAGCLHEHHKDLSEPCKQSIQEKKSNRMEKRQKRRAEMRKRRRDAQVEKSIEPIATPDVPASQPK